MENEGIELLNAILEHQQILTAKGLLVDCATAWFTLEDAMLLLYLMVGPVPITYCNTPRGNRSLLPRPAPSVTMAACTMGLRVARRVSPSEQGTQSFQLSSDNIN